MANVLGLITVNGKEILEVDADPSAGAGTPAPKGSMSMFDNGTSGIVYIKTGAADTAWQSIDVPEGQDWELFGNTLTGTEWMGSKNDQDVVFKRNNTEVFRLFNLGMLIGLNSSLGGRLQVAAGTLGDEIIKQISPNGGTGDQVIHVTRQYKVFTTDATETVLASLAVPAACRIQANLMICGSQSGGTAGATGDGASYERTIDAKRLVAGNAVLKKYQTDFTSEDVGSFDVKAAVNTNNIDVSVIGGADRNISWFAHAQILIAGV